MGKLCQVIKGLRREDMKKWKESTSRDCDAIVFLDDLLENH